MFSRFAIENLMKNGGTIERFSAFHLSHNFSFGLRLGSLYESNVIRASTRITIIHFALRVVSAEFHTSRSEARR